MEIRVDLSTIPPILKLVDPDDFSRFSVSCSAVQESFVRRAALEELAGERANDADWARQLQGMLDYAGSKGWVREDGSIQAHLDWRS